jgi:hypothetical protein
LRAKLVSLILIKIKGRQTFPEEVVDLLLTVAVNIDSPQIIEEIILLTQVHLGKPIINPISEQRVMRSSII